MSIEILKWDKNHENYVKLAGFAKSGIKIDITYPVNEDVTFKLF